MESDVRRMMAHVFRKEVVRSNELAENPNAFELEYITSTLFPDLETNKYCFALSAEERLKFTKMIESNNYFASLNVRGVEYPSNTVSITVSM